MFKLKAGTGMRQFIIGAFQLPVYLWKSHTLVNGDIQLIGNSSFRR